MSASFTIPSHPSAKPITHQRANSVSASLTTSLASIGETGYPPEGEFCVCLLHYLPRIHRRSRLPTRGRILCLPPSLPPSHPSAKPITHQRANSVSASLATSLASIGEAGFSSQGEFCVCLPHYLPRIHRRSRLPTRGRILCLPPSLPPSPPPVKLVTKKVISVSASLTPSLSPVKPSTRGRFLCLPFN